MPDQRELCDYVEMTAQKPADVAMERECFRSILAGLPAVASVFELFGGTGVFRGVLEEQGLTRGGAACEAWDTYERCLAILAARYPDSKLVRTDSFTTPLPTGMDLLSADFNVWTFYRYRKVPRYAEVTRRIFEAGAKYVQLTDAAVSRFGLNRRRYEDAFRVEGLAADGVAGIAQYAHNVSRHFSAQFGYAVMRAAGHAHATYLLFTRGEVRDFDVVKIRRGGGGQPRLF